MGNNYYRGCYGRGTGKNYLNGSYRRMKADRGSVAIITADIVDSKGIMFMVQTIQ